MLSICPLRSVQVARRVAVPARLPRVARLLVATPGAAPTLRQRLVLVAVCSARFTRRDNGRIATQRVFEPYCREVVFHLHLPPENEIRANPGMQPQTDPDDEGAGFPTPRCPILFPAASRAYQKPGRLNLLGTAFRATMKLRGFCCSWASFLSGGLWHYRSRFPTRCQYS
jgi:hypothetical protein